MLPHSSKACPQGADGRRADIGHAIEFTWFYSKQTMAHRLQNGW
jgi:hypothetical protein